jgi:hypothetical protein
MQNKDDTASLTEGNPDTTDRETNLVTNEEDSRLLYMTQDKQYQVMRKMIPTGQQPSVARILVGTEKQAVDRHTPAGAGPAQEASFVSTIPLTSEANHKSLCNKSLRTSDTKTHNNSPEYRASKLTNPNLASKLKSRQKSRQKSRGIVARVDHRRGEKAAITPDARLDKTGDITKTLGLGAGG